MFSGILSLALSRSLPLFGLSSARLEAVKGLKQEKNLMTERKKSHDGKSGTQYILKGVWG